MESIEDFAYSRLTNEENCEVVEKENLRVKKDGIFSCKLGYHSLCMRKDDKLVKCYLPQIKKNFNRQKFEKLQKVQSPYIQNFINAHKPDRKSSLKESKSRKRKNSQIKQQQGSYYLNNWLSNEQYYCEFPQKGISLVAHLIFMKRYDRAKKELNKLQSSLQSAMLMKILNNFTQLLSVIKKSEMNEVINWDVLERECMVDSIESKYFVNLFNKQQHNEFLAIQNIEHQRNIILQNMNFLISFIKKIPTHTMNNYYQLIFRFLSNQTNSNIDNDTDYLELLLQYPNLYLPDRINFATKLLKDDKKKIFVNQLEDSLSMLSDLDNIIYYDVANNRKVHKIRKICQNYIDQYGDLETLAQLSYQYPFLKQYKDLFVELLTLAYEQEYIHKMQSQNSIKYPSKDEETIIQYNKKHLFLNLLLFEEEKIFQVEKSMETKSICQICYQNSSKKSESYLECVKCGHGGHLSHIRKWFKNNKNCPNIDCACLCN